MKNFKNFREKYGQDWKARWSDRTGTPVFLLELPIQIPGADAQEIAKQFLRLNRRLFGLKENLSDLEIHKVEKHKRATHVVFQQKYRNLPVEGAVYAVHFGSVYDHHSEAGSIVNRVLTNLQGNGYYLNGTYVQSFNEDAAEAYEPDLTFIYSPSNTHIDEVMVYYHANRFQDIFLDNLGYPYLNYSHSLVKVEVTVHWGTNYNNAGAAYPNTLLFGDGYGINYNDFAKEDVVIFHEYQHLVTEYMTYDGLDGGYEEDAMDETFSDYFGCSFADTPKQGEYVKIGSGSLRNLDNNYKKSDLEWATLSRLQPGF